jgi:hypothetical protein
MGFLTTIAAIFSIAVGSFLGLFVHSSLPPAAPIVQTTAPVSTIPSQLAQPTTPPVTASNPTQILVAGMSEYTDTDLGFSFWYPDGWTVQQKAVSDPNEFPGGTVLKNLEVFGGSGNNTDEITIDEYNSPTMTITDPNPGITPMGEPSPAVRYYFDPSASAWMMQYPDGIPSSKDGSVNPSSIGATSLADVSVNTMGGLHIFQGSAPQGDDVIIPLSAEHFLIVSSGNGDEQQDTFVQTILATDPSVATPVSTAQQESTIEAEKSEYGTY